MENQMTHSRVILEVVIGKVTAKATHVRLLMIAMEAWFAIAENAGRLAEAIRALQAGKLVRGAPAQMVNRQEQLQMQITAE